MHIFDILIERENSFSLALTFFSVGLGCVVALLQFRYHQNTASRLIFLVMIANFAAAIGFYLNTNAQQKTATLSSAEPEKYSNPPVDRSQLQPKPVNPTEPEASKARIKAEAYIGTVPPDGEPTIAFTLANWSFDNNAKAVEVETYTLDAGNIKTIDKRHIPFIGAGSGSTVQFASPIWTGKVSICLVYQMYSSEIIEAFYFQSGEGRGRYPPMEKMSPFRDSDQIANVNKSCKALQKNILSALRGE